MTQNSNKLKYFPLIIHAGIPGPRFAQVYKGIFLVGLGSLVEFPSQLNPCQIHTHQQLTRISKV